MLKCLKIVFFLLMLASAAQAQKIGFVDSEYILNKHPDYKIVQEELKKQAAAWKKEAQNLENKIKEMYSALKAEEVLLTEDMYKERMEAIRQKEKAASNYNTRVFGINGEYYQKQDELMKPLQSKIFDAIDRVSKRNGIAIMFDKAADLSMIYTDPVHDYSDFVIEELGIDESLETEEAKQDQ
ncbi:OmpH family outer membrane protein [Echinicola vietnamensis]|uniref:Outer membrane protein n=1 Tax=Echinicola vietnamensis (strain DSM 17526 / LMG 23754 / KMM 6221) TaxID=926556 RepID=L0FW84_ECHVK|nr:OmpH family outer membrane protein [Echinicola vietnamensis]AGA76930.1 outer membrane protein [Echinicola vietnamensis DSM 17526]